MHVDEREVRNQWGTFAGLVVYSPWRDDEALVEPDFRSNRHALRFHFPGGVLEYELISWVGK
jgi:hypothetical protein